jgi:SAM-dependent methyltransferase
VYRSLNPESYQLIRSFLQSPVYAHLVKRGSLIATDLVDDATHTALAEAEGLPGRFYVKHKRLWFLSYPYEWTAEMLLDAARCTLLVQSTLMEYGFSLKDASCYNVQFNLGIDGPTPIFIDIGSIEPLSNTRGIWLPYKQFLGNFLLPLLYYRNMGYDFKAIFLADLDGFDPEQAYSLVKPLRRLLPPYLTLVTIPHWLRQWEARRGPRLRCQKVKNSEVEQDKTLFILRHIMGFLQRRIDSLGSGPTQSAWVDYEEQNIYPPDARAGKLAFVRQICQQRRPETVLDIGCNVGQFSFVAAEFGAKVLALDSNLASLDRLYRRAKERKATVLPLRMDITNPSPGIGWKNSERRPFLDRVAESDCVFALAIVHHILITKGIPLLEIVRLFHRLTNRYLVVELVDPSDPMFQSLLRGREHLYSTLSLEAQEQIFTRHFAVLESHSCTGMARKLYLMEKKR